MNEEVPPRDRETLTHRGAARRLRVGETLAGRYRVEAMLGVGAMGAVYRVRDEELQVDVALKALRPELGEDEEARERFRREIVLSRQVSHPNVVRIHDIGHDDDVTFLTMDLVEGRSLRSILESEGALPAERAVDIATGIAAGLAAAHREGIVHRDLKPENVLLDESGTPRIVDFGVARAVGHARLTETGLLVGTLSYLSPEQAAGAEVDARSDLYALGLVLFEMLTGELPFRRASHQEMLAQRLVATPRLEELEGRVEPPVVAAIAGLLARDPQDRHATAEDFLDVLRVGRPRTVRPASGIGIGKIPRRTAGLLAGGVVLLLLLAGAGLLFRALGGRAGSGEEPTVGAPGGEAPSLALAVLPFDDETGRPELAWVSRGTAEMVAENLAGSAELQVLDPVRVFRVLRDLDLEAPWSESTLRNLADLLGVDRLVTGRVRSLGEGLQIEARIEAPSLPEGRSASLRFEAVEPGRLPAATTRVAADVAAALSVRSPERPESPEIAPAAREAYDEGLERWVEGDALGAVELLERAVAVAPALPRAWIHLADAYESLGGSRDAERALAEASRSGVRPGSRQALEIRIRRARLDGDVEEAKALSEELVARYPGDVEARVALARVLGDGGDLERARRALEAVVEQAPKHPQAWFLLAKYSIQSGEAERAVDDYLVRALVLQNRLGNDQGRADVLNAMGVAFDHLGRLDEGLARYQEAAEIRERIGDRRGLATSLRNLSAIHAVRGETAAAEAELARAAEILEDLGDRQGLADLANDQGLLAEEQGRYREALDGYRRGLALRRESGDRRGIAESAYNVSFAYFQLGELDNAHAYAQQAVDLFEQGGVPEGLVFARQMLATLEIARGEWRDAARLYLETLESSRALGMKDTIAVARGGLGDVFLLQGDYRSAQRHYAEARSEVEAMGDQRGRVEFTLDAAELRLHTGEVEKAGALLDEAAGWLGEGESREQKSRLLRLRGELAWIEGRPEEARRLATAARDEALAGHAVLVSLEARRLLGETLVAVRPAAAVEELERLLADVQLAGHLPIELATIEGLVRAQLAAGREGEAERRLRAVVGKASEAGYEGTFRLQHLLGRALQAAGEAEAAARQRDAARRELERIRELLPEGARSAFDALPEVKEVAVEGKVDDAA